MQTFYTRLRIGHFYIRHALIVVIAGILFVQPLMASDSWSRVKKIKKGTKIYVHDTNDQSWKDQSWQGTFLHADDSGMTFQTVNQGKIDLDRDRVSQIRVWHSNSRAWFRIPLVIAAGVAGGFGGKAFTDRVKCSGSRSECSYAKGLIISFSAIGAAVGAGLVTEDLMPRKSGWKLIYSKWSD